MKLRISTKVFYLTLILTSAVFTACNQNENPKPIPPVLSQDSARALDQRVLIDKVRSMLGDSAAVIEPGRYQNDSTVSGVAVGKEISTREQWGIRFVYYKNQNDNLVKAYESPLLKGSFNESMVRKIKLAGSSYEMIYYDSQDYYLGSGGGEIFSYIVDFDKNNVYSAHFFSVSRQPVSLYISPNTDNQEVRDIFLKHFRKDYPELRVVSKDYNLEEIR